jgi:FkbM family methyltransferase
MIKKAVKTIFKFLFKPILNRYHLILDKLDNIDKNNHLLHERLDFFEHRINDVSNNLNSVVDKLSNQQELLDIVLKKAKRMELYYQFMISQYVEIKNNEELLPFGNYMIIVKKDKKSPIDEQIRQYGDFGEKFELFFNNSGIFLDIGANIGAVSLRLASFGWKGYAFEAGAINADMLERSIKVNKFDVKVIKKAVHEKSGKLYFSEQGPYGHVVSNLSPGGGEVEEIDSISLDDWIETEGIQNIDFIKMDIEGSEPAALRGMKKMLIRYNCPPIFCEINSFTLGFYKETQKSIFLILSDLEYKPFSIDNIDGKMQLVEFDVDQPPVVVCTDFLFVKNFKNIRLNVQPFVKDKKEKIVSRIIEQLSHYQSWGHGYNGPPIETADYICLALRDYPEYLENMQIRKYLTEIKNMKKKSSLLDWYNP